MQEKMPLLFGNKRLTGDIVLDIGEMIRSSAAKSLAHRSTSILQSDAPYRTKFHL
jgi:hypothetical protein